LLILHKTIPNKGKIKNGDSLKTYEDETIFIGCVADGVGGCPCDYKASDQVSGDLIYYYLNEFRHLGVKEGIAHSLRKTFARLYYTSGECQGMLTTLVSLIIDKTTNDFYTISIGDSKILSINQSAHHELSKETDFRIQPDALFFHVIEHGKITDQTGFALMTDGFWANGSNFESDLAFLLRSAKTIEFFDQLFARYQQTQTDDMTLMVVKFHLGA
jgi:serine/threonine protein phosphatase PrpC